MTQLVFSGDFSDWAAGVGEELGSLGSEVRGCTGSTTTAFQSREELRECDGVNYVRPSVDSNTSLSLEQLSKYAWIENKFEKFLAQLSESYRHTYELYQFAENGISKNENTQDKFEDAIDHFHNLYHGRLANLNFEAAIKELKCDDPRAGNWNERQEICQKLKSENKAELIEYNRLASYAKYPFLNDPILQSAIDRGVQLPKNIIREKIKKAIKNQFNRIREKQREVLDILSSPHEIARYASATPGPSSSLGGEEWATLSFLVYGIENDLSESNPKFIHAKCLYEENLLNHQKLMGWSSLKKNVLLTAVSLGAGGAAMRFARGASLGSRAVALSGATAALGVSALGIALVDYPEIKEISERCHVHLEILQTIEASSGEYLDREKKLIECEKEFSTALVFSAISPVADIISTASVAGRLYFSGELVQQASSNQARVALKRQQATQVPTTREPQVTTTRESQVPTTRAPARATPPTPAQLKDQFFSRSNRVLDVARSPEDFAEQYKVSIEQAREILAQRRQSIFNVDQTINHRNSPGQQTLTRDSLTAAGRKKYDSIEAYNREVDFPPMDAPAMTVRELVSRVTYDLGGNSSFAGRRFQALSSAMDNFFEMKKWHQDLFDSSLDFLLRSENDEWIEYFNRTGKIPKEVTETVLLERAQLYGWGGQFTDLEGGILPQREFGQHIASGNYIRERDLDSVVRDAADNGRLRPEQAERVKSGEIIHGDLTHAAHMDYLLYLSSQGRMGDIKPEQVKEIITSYGQGLVRRTPGAVSAWGALFDMDASGSTMRTPNVFYSIFGRELNL